MRATRYWGTLAVAGILTVLGGFYLLTTPTFKPLVYFFMVVGAVGAVVSVIALIRKSPPR